MVELDDWLFLSLNYKPRLEKPPLPIWVLPLSCAVPRCKVALSRITLRSPISRVVGSPAYFLS